MIKKILLTVNALIFSCLILNAQFSPKTKGLVSFSKFKKSETYFVLTDRKDLNESFKRAVDNNWDITIKHFITEEEFLELTEDRYKTFVYFHDLKQQGVGKKMKALVLVNGGYDQKATYISNCLAYVSIDSDGLEANDLDIVYRLNNVVAQLQNIAFIMRENNIIEKSSEKVRSKMIKIYNSSSRLLKDKTLLIDRRYLSHKIISEKAIQSLYKYDLEFVNKEVIEKAIRLKSSSYAYLTSSLNLFKINTITDCNTGEIIYASFDEENERTHEFEKNFTKDDVYLLNEIIKRSK